MSLLKKQQMTALILVIVNKISPLLLFLFSVIFCWYLAASFWLVLAPPKPQQLTPINLSATTPKSSFSGVSFNLFKNNTIDSQLDDNAESSNPVEPNVLLEGVMVAQPKKLSSAIFNQNGNSKRYQIYDKIDDSDYSLEEVSFKAVVLMAPNGDRVELPLYEAMVLNSAKNITTNTVNTNVPNQNQQDRQDLMSVQQSTIQPKTVGIEQQKKSVKEQVNDMLDKATEQLRQDPASYLNNMGVMSVGDGYVVTNQMNQNIRKNIGLKEGDKVISVNGQQLGQPQVDASLLEDIKNTGTAEIKIQRGSQVITVRQQF